MSGDATGERALPYLVDPQRSAGASGQLLFNMAAVAAADAYTGAVVRASIEGHLATDSARACVWQPTSAEVWATVHDLLRPLPPNCTFPDDVQAPLRDPRVFVPAHSVRDMSYADALAHHIVTAGAAAGLDPPETGLLATALPGFVDNGLRHAPKSPCGVVVCGAVSPGSGDGQLVAADLGGTVSGSPDAPAAVRAAVRQSQKRFGGLHATLLLARQRDLDITMTIASGTGRARWRGRWHYYDAQFIPGWCVGLSVHSQRRRQEDSDAGPKTRVDENA